MFYQDTKTAKAAVIGTIMSWTGGLTSIPKGWVLCNGQALDAADYPLLTQAIGNTYDAAGGSITGSFPSYTGTIKLPDLNEKMLMDIESSYFGVGGNSTGRPADEDIDALTIIDPYIATNESNATTTIFTDVTTDVVFEIDPNDRVGYIGKITGNTKEDGDGVATVFVAPRKLGRKHIKRHNHPGQYETIYEGDRTKPGDGVAAFANVAYTLYHSAVDNEGGGDKGDAYYFGWSDDDGGDGDSDSTGIVNAAPGIAGGNSAINGGVAMVPIGEEPTYMFTWPSNDDDAPDGFAGSGSSEVILAHVRSESPPVNLKPKAVAHTPITNRFRQTPSKPSGPWLDSNESIPAGGRSQPFDLPNDVRNYYTRAQLAANIRDTMMSHPGYSFLSDDADDFIEPHDHGEFDVTFSSVGLRPQSSIICDVNLPNTVVLDNVANQKALQIDMNISQPTLSCIYIIRAY